MNGTSESSIVNAPLKIIKIEMCMLRDLWTIFPAQCNSQANGVTWQLLLLEGYGESVSYAANKDVSDVFCNSVRRYSQSNRLMTYHCSHNFEMSWSSSSPQPSVS